MTKREAMTAIVNGELTAEVQAFAAEEIVKMDNANARRKGVPSKATKDNAIVRENAIAFVAEHPGCVREDIATALEITPQKVSALLAKEPRVTAVDTKVVDADGKKHARKAYTLAE